MAIQSKANMAKIIFFVMRMLFKLMLLTELSLQKIQTDTKVVKLMNVVLAIKP